MNKIEDILRFIFGIDKKEYKTSTITNQQILKEILKHFSKELVNNSVNETMIYPMTFYIHMHPDDYNIRKQNFPILFPEIVKCFYEIILRYKKKYPEYIGKAQSWNFYIVPCFMENFSVNGNNFTIKRGKIIIWSSMYDVVDQSSPNAGKSCSVSVRLDGSNLMTEININREILDNLQFVSENHFRMDWIDPIKKQDVKLTQSTQHGIQFTRNLRTELGILRYNMYGGTQQYIIKTSTCKISNETDERQDPSIFKVKNMKVGIAHAEIRYDRIKNIFELAAYKETAINNKAIAISKGNNLNWVPLNNGAVITLSGNVIINFEKLI